MRHADLSFRALAKRAGYAGASSIQTHLDEEADVISVDVAIKLARSLEGLGTPPLVFADIVRVLSGVALVGVTVSKPQEASVTLVSSRVLRITGAVQAGNWMNASNSGDLQYSVTVPVPPQWSGYDLIGLEVRGPSMDRIYPPGTILICVAYSDLSRQPRHGERVIVQRFRGDEVEASCKEYRRDVDGIIRLWPVSNHPDHQAPLRLLEEPGAEEIRVTHRVVAAIVTEPA